ncbi:MAG: hypothetical protein ACOCQV_02850 [Halolamina sp.]
MAWLPIPPTIVESARSVFSGGLFRILWRVFVLAIGLVILGLLAASGSYILASLAGIIVWIALSSTVRGIMLDIYNGRGIRL